MHVGPEVQDTSSESKCRVIRSWHSAPHYGRSKASLVVELDLAMRQIQPLLISRATAAPSLTFFAADAIGLRNCEASRSINRPIKHNNILRVKLTGHRP